MAPREVNKAIPEMVLCSGLCGMAVNNSMRFVLAQIDVDKVAPL